ncbi:MAG: nitrile hydratase accessory protein [Alphaproteobacteria bacterium]|nr:nitrile hydratase accessory protein [Alphaproteobacteria bacterium]
MNAHNTTPIAPLASRDGEPTFAEPWQAEVLALAFGLIQENVVTAAEWSDMLGAALRQSAEDGDPDDQTTYYMAILTALERLVAADGRVTTECLSERVEQWRRAYLNTPHGQPVNLSAGAADHRAP